MGRRALRLMVFAFLTIGGFTSHVAHAENLGLLRRWVVFPFDSDTPNLKNPAENAWWKSRERLTNTKKYLVASRQFMIQKDVFQPRKVLSPDNVKLLANLMDADVVVTGFNENREFQLNVYLGQNGELFWSKKLSFHPSLKAADQLELISDKLTQEMISQIPYQGFVVTDPLIGKTIYEENSKKYVVIDVGNTTDIQEGMDIQWVQVELPEKSKDDTPIIDQTKVNVVGDGKIAQIKNGMVVAELDRTKGVELINEKTLVTLPKLATRLAETYLAQDINKEKNSPDSLPDIINPIAPESQGAHRNTLVFGSLVSILGLLLLGL